MTAELISRGKAKLAECLSAVRENRMTQDEYLEEMARIHAEDAGTAKLLSDALGIAFSPRVDGLGAYYAQARTKGESVLVNVFPPARLWNGDFAPQHVEIHESAWQLLLGDKLKGQSETITGLQELLDSENDGTKSQVNK